MKDDLQLKYDDLLEEGWRPRLQSRKDLVAWACRQLKSGLGDNDQLVKELPDCENTSLFIKKYGPNYDIVHKKWEARNN